MEFPKIKCRRCDKLLYYDCDCKHVCECKNPTECVNEDGCCQRCTNYGCDCEVCEDLRQIFIFGRATFL